LKTKNRLSKLQQNNEVSLSTRTPSHTLYCEFDIHLHRDVDVMRVCRLICCSRSTVLPTTRGPSSLSEHPCDHVITSHTRSISVCPRRRVDTPPLCTRSARNGRAVPRHRSTHVCVERGPCRAAPMLALLRLHSRRTPRLVHIYSPVNTALAPVVLILPLIHV
jgi:hypothetical protein